MTPMNWEPMTEDAVFEDGEEVLVWHRLGQFATHMGYDATSRKFSDGEGCKYTIKTFTHFARITNPNEVMP